MRYTLSIDDDLLERAGVALGTQSAQDTVDASLQETVRREASRRAATPPTTVTERSSRLPDRTDLSALLAPPHVMPVQSLEQLRGDFWPDEEDVDEFISAVQQWRQEGTRP